jgi:hypothetical protein
VLGYFEAAKMGGYIVSLRNCYKVLWRDGLIYTVLYWLAVPTLLFAEYLLKCGGEPFSPAERVRAERAYLLNDLPTDAPPYEEYLLIQKYIHERYTPAECVEVRDALYA